MVTNNNNRACSSTAPAVSPSGTLTYTPAANAFGTATVTVQGQGQRRHRQRRRRRRAPRRPSPSPSTRSTTRRASPRAPTRPSTRMPGRRASPAGRPASRPARPNESGQTRHLHRHATTPTRACSPPQPAMSADGTLTYTPAANAFGTATVTRASAKDNGGTANGGVDDSPTQTFTITVNPVNDAPSFTKGADQTVAEDAGAQTVAGWATAISRRAGQRVGADRLTFLVTGNTNASLFAAAARGQRQRHADLHAGRQRLRHGDDHAAGCRTTAAPPTAASTTSATQTFTITVNARQRCAQLHQGRRPDRQRGRRGRRPSRGWATAHLRRPGRTSRARRCTFIVTSNTNPACSPSQPAVQLERHADLHAGRQRHRHGDDHGHGQGRRRHRQRRRRRQPDRRPS